MEDYILKSILKRLRPIRIFFSIPLIIMELIGIILFLKNIFLKQYSNAFSSLSFCITMFFIFFMLYSLLELVTGNELIRVLLKKYEISSELMIRKYEETCDDSIYKYCDTSLRKKVPFLSDDDYNKAIENQNIYILTFKRHSLAFFY